MLTMDRVLTYRTGRIGMCLIAAMIYISLVSVDLFVPDWSENNTTETGAEQAVKDAYYFDDDEVRDRSRILRARRRPLTSRHVFEIALYFTMSTLRE